jgi:hypothetical protein
MRRAVLALAGACALASGCCGPAPPPFHPVADAGTVCQAIIDPSAMKVWNAVGWIETSSGTEEIYPRTDEEWLAVRNAAAAVAEGGNLMMMEPRARDADWMRVSRGLVDMGEEAMRAADAQDRDRIFKVGGDLYEVCTNCHSKYNRAIAPAAGP